MRERAVSRARCMVVGSCYGFSCISWRLFHSPILVLSQISVWCMSVGADGCAEHAGAPDLFPAPVCSQI